MDDNASGFDYEIKLSTDRNGNPDSAMKFENDGSIDTMELPAKIMNNLWSYTIGIWVKVE